MAKNDNLFKKYHDRIAREGMLKAILYGVIIGCGALLITAFFSWFFGFRAGLWLSLALFVVGIAVSVPAFYFFRFRPTTQQIARRVDELGLEERLVTMIEYENDDSYIAKCQREDAQRALGSVDHMMVKIVLSAALIVCFAVAVFVGLSMTTVSSLYYANVIPSGISLMLGEEKVNRYTVEYAVKDGGNGEVYFYADNNSDITLVDGPILVEEGEDAPAVYAYAGFDSVFVEWSDGVQSPYRKDVNVQADMKVYAIFQELNEQGTPTLDQLRNGQDGESGSGNNNNDQDAPPTSDADGNGDGTPEAQPPADPTSSASGQSSDSNKQVNDGSTYVGDVYNDAYNGATDRLGSDNNIGKDAAQGAMDYLDGIQRGTSGGNQGGAGGGTGGTVGGAGGD